MSQYCEKFRCYVGSEFCKLCPEQCDHPSMEGDVNHDRSTIRTRRVNSQRNGFRKRRKALKLAERDLKATYLYASTGHPIHSDCEWKEDVPSTKCVQVVEGEGEINSEVGSILDQELDL